MAAIPPTYSSPNLLALLNDAPGALLGTLHIDREQLRHDTTPRSTR